MLGNVFDGADSADIKLSDKTKNIVRGIVNKYNKLSAEFALNALSILGYATGKGKKIFGQMLTRLKNYELPEQKPRLTEDNKYMHPGLRKAIAKASPMGIRSEDWTFFKSLYDMLGVKP